VDEGHQRSTGPGHIQAATEVSHSSGAGERRGEKRDGEKAK